MLCIVCLLILLTDSCCDNVTKIQSYGEDSVSFSCPYESEHQNNLKYVCRGKQPSTCLQQALITSDNKHNGQFALTDDKMSRKFTVTINSLTQKDSGSYLCGVHKNTGLDAFSAVELEVKDSHLVTDSRHSFGFAFGLRFPPSWIFSHMDSVFLQVSRQLCFSLQTVVLSSSPFAPGLPQPVFPSVFSSPSSEYSSLI
uniref:Immunoglobulin V-set domain-containing protein n=1 Tax=Amphiprion percula TaxID=161767 RepID=A0A3P8SZD6_AMPPE